MATRRILTGVALLLLSFSTFAGGKQTVPEGYVRVAQAHSVPPESLYSVSLQESSRRLPQGERPWPWTLNVAGKGYRYKTRLEAWQALQVFMKTNSLKRIDVGIAQVNLGWNGQRFTSTWEALDPYVNLNAAAAILRECWDRKPGSWLDAAGCYHHPAGGAPAARYRAFVKSKLAMLQSSPHLPAATAVEQTASASVPDNGLVWIDPRSQ
ncbi:lytic transglycosylase domain-containing protein (plasmid) [Pantoea piersonii]|uniref:Lytic transglycosylase domain-containing protein n=1 Tax=Pantoea piersonii TaxID=2364647 RepID=A0AAJ5QNE8_9GAMM|nr:lytic transglycosylase domain-containing protein [Pantoea piersonii]POW52727.1 lytic transglycosylase [Pantoea alvi]WBG93513.1 lytic transglycosylase domain-containing protein [Pantoea piersonii]